MIVNNYHYKTFVHTANRKGFTIKRLAHICGLTEKTLSKQLKAIDGYDLKSSTSRILRDAVAPDSSLDDLFREASGYSPPLDVLDD